MELLGLQEPCEPANCCRPKDMADCGRKPLLDGGPLMLEDEEFEVDREEFEGYREVFDEYE